MFDITQGRSTGSQVQAISRSARTIRRAASTATSATTSSTRRIPVPNRVLPYQNEQVGATLGGRSSRTSSYISPRTSTSASRRRSSHSRAAAGAVLHIREHRVNHSMLSRVDQNLSTKDNLSHRCRSGTSRARSSEPASPSVQRVRAHATRRELPNELDAVISANKVQRSEPASPLRLAESGCRREDAEHAELRVPRHHVRWSPQLPAASWPEPRTRFATT